MTLQEEKNLKEILQSRDVLVNENLQLKARLKWYEEQLGLANKRLHAPSSEKSPLGQEVMIFDEAEACASPVSSEPQTETISYTRHKTVGKRDDQLEGLPVEEIEYTLPEEERVCPKCFGPLHAMGHDVRREIKLIPAKVILVLHNRTNYTCRHCQNHEIKTPVLCAPAPETAFPGSLASPSAVAYVMTRKFAEGMPLYRQERSLKLEGFELSRQTMSNWMLTGAKWLSHIYDRMQSIMMERDILHADETTLQVLKEQNRAPWTESYMWLYRTGREGPPIILFEYQPTRLGEHPKRFLKNFSGYLHVDGYGGYNKLTGVKQVGCWAHARRKFNDAVNVIPQKDRKKATHANQGLVFCNKLFDIERELHDVTAEERFAGREAKSKDVLDNFHLWLMNMQGRITPNTALGKAVNYCLNQWEKLTVFLLDGRLEIDNNRAERSIKPFVIGRKNWLFANTPRGANASATIYSIVESAKENGLSPYAYLTYLFEKLPNIDVKDPQAIDLLLPWAEPVQAQFRVNKATR